MGKLGAWVGGDCLLIVSDVCADWGEVNVLNEVRGVFGLRVHTATFYVLEERFYPHRYPLLHTHINIPNMEE